MGTCDSSLCSLQTPGVGKINKHIWQSRRLRREWDGTVCKRSHLLRKQKLFNDSISGRANGVLMLMGVIIDKHFNPTLKQVQNQLWWGLCHTETHLHSNIKCGGLSFPPVAYLVQLVLSASGMSPQNCILKEQFYQNTKWKHIQPSKPNSFGELRNVC